MLKPITKNADATGNVLIETRMWTDLTRTWTTSMTWTTEDSNRGPSANNRAVEPEIGDEPELEGEPKLENEQNSGDAYRGQLKRNKWSKRK